MKKQPKAVYIIENGGYTELTYEEFRRREQICPLYADKLFLPLYGRLMEVSREASEMFQCIKYEDKREVFGLKIHSFSTLDRIKKYDDSDNEENAEKPYSIKVGETKRTINLYAIATTKFQIAV